MRFTPGTAAEQPWAADLTSSQLDGKIFDGHGRFTDGATYFTYRLDFPAGATGGSLTLHIGNQFLVRVSTDGENWRTVLREEREIRDLSNLADRTLDLAPLHDGDGPLFVRVEDSFPTDGWAAGSGA